MKLGLKRILSIAVASALVFSMAACGGGGNDSGNKSKNDSGIKIESDLSMAPAVQAYLDKVNHEYAYGIAETLAYDEKYLSNETGWRTAGSDAEHAAADYLAGEMETLGLEEVEKVPVTVDKWQFNGASLTIDGTDIHIVPGSYATNGTDKDGITAEIVDVGTGTAAEYEGKDVKGKIALAGVDQWNEAWIDQYMNEAALHGAAAIVTYDVGGYGTYSDDVINVQDVCAKDVMPCVCISKSNYEELAAAIKEGNTQATLMVDNVMEPEKGTSYNVIGKIKGKSSDQQIIVSGHYDVYWNGFQDDSCAIGLVLAMAKGMRDSEYTPENDIIFVAHGSEEWGATGTQFDWTTGAWEMINTAHPEWVGKTLAMINFELPALYDGLAQAQIQCEPEFAPMAKEFMESTGLNASPANDVYPEGFDSTTVDTFCLEDGVSYRMAGVPHFINVPGMDMEKVDTNWNQQRYHTVADNKDTYNADVMTTNLNTFGALAIYIDQTPALKLNFAATCDDIDEALNEDLAKAAGADIETYKTASKHLRTAADALNKKIDDINARYEKAVADGASDEDLKAIRDEGKALNKTTLKAYKYVQDHFINIILTSDIVIKHLPYQINIETISAVIDALKKGDLTSEETGALACAAGINGGAEYGYYNFSPETNEASQDTLLEDRNEGNLFWGTGKGTKLANTYKATTSLLAKAEAAEKGKKVSYDKEIAIYNKAIKQQQKEMKAVMDKETKAMDKLAGQLK